MGKRAIMRVTSGRYNQALSIYEKMINLHREEGVGAGEGGEESGETKGGETGGGGVEAGAEKKGVEEDEGRDGSKEDNEGTHKELGLAQTLQEMAEVYVGKKDYSKAQPLLREALVIQERAGNQNSLASARTMQVRGVRRVQALYEEYERKREAM
jgi:tetratricopeptide (TPR) repeat protein